MMPYISGSSNAWKDYTHKDKDISSTAQASKQALPALTNNELHTQNDKMEAQTHRLGGPHLDTDGLAPECGPAHQPKCAPA